jgi:D-threo-aldose 1-dehydrogenase
MDPAETRPLSETGVHVTQLGFGSAPLGELFTTVSDDEAHETLSAARDCGIRYFDTAPFYGMGLSEHRVGRFLRSIPREDVVLSTKVGRILRRPFNFGRARPSPFTGGLSFDYSFDYGYDGIMRAFEDSIQRLGLTHIDLLVIHDLDYWSHSTETRVSAHLSELISSGWRALDELRSEGVVKGLGAGVNELGMIPRLIDAVDLDFVLVAMRYTLLDQRTLEVELPLCVDRQISVIVGAVFNSGILATGAVPGAKYDYQAASPEILDRVRKIEAVCERYDVPLPAAALQFPLGHPSVAAVIPGGFLPEHVRTNAALFKREIPGALWEELKSEGLLHSDAPVPA